MSRLRKFLRRREAVEQQQWDVDAWPFPDPAVYAPRPACCTGIDRDHRCSCGRPVPASSSCGCCCAEHDIPAAMQRHPAGKALNDRSNT